ncbi:MAG: methionine--tRNA ligase [bacterium]
MNKKLVTAALPYANGHIHIGHLVEYIQADIYVKFQKLIGNTCHFICADDTHGTPIMMSAKQQNISPEELIATYQHAHQTDFKRFNIEFDYYGTTHCDENQALAEQIYHAAQKQDLIYTKTIKQFYSLSEKMFLPDRFVKGTCPKCGATDQYGDSCDKCGASYASTELIDPKCALSNTTPELRDSEHYFFKLKDHASFIKNWLKETQIPQDIKNKCQEWFESGLKDWNISRDEPYFGFKIPGTDNKYFYVWMDAPIGYIANSQCACKNQDWNWQDVWQKDDAYELHHFIGKDIVYFHTLFWPVLLKTGGFRLPDRVNVHGFLTVNGEKMSKSKGTFILANDFADNYEPELLRYYYASKLSAKTDDIDLNMHDFVLKCNSDVLGKVLNIGSRLASILNKKCNQRLTTLCPEGENLLKTLRAESDSIKAHYEAINTQKATQCMMALADQVNGYIDQKAPWALVKENQSDAEKVCTTGLNALYILAVYLQPILPIFTQKITQFLNVSIHSWDDHLQTFENHPIKPYEHIMKRLDKPE